MTREQALQTLIDLIVESVVDEILREERGEITPNNDEQQDREAA